MPRTKMRPLVGKNGGKLGLVEQVKRPRADHDRRAQPRHAVRGSRRVIDDQRPWYLRVVVGKQPEQCALAVPGPEHGGHRRHKYPAQQREQQDARDQRNKTQRGHHVPAPICPVGPEHQPGSPGGRRPDARQAGASPPGQVRSPKAGQRPDRCHAPAQAERLPERDRDGW